MAKITSHTLDGFSGNHAAGIEVTLINTKTGLRMFRAKMDEGGRLSVEIASEDKVSNIKLIYQRV